MNTSHNNRLVSNDYKRALDFISAEVVLTSVLISMPVMNLFFQQAGMSTAAVGVSQAVFTLVILLLDIPAGYFADKISRKWANVMGDTVIGCSLIYYSFATNLWWVISAEIMFGVGLALSNGADRPLIRHYCEMLRPNNSAQKLKKTDARNVSWSLSAQALGVIIGGLVGASFSPAWAVRLSSITYIAGAILSSALIETPRLAQQTSAVKRSLKSRFEKACSELKAVVSDHVLGWNEVTALVFACAVGSNSTHAMIWLLTPLALAAGVPVKLIGISWAINLIMGVIGSRVADRHATHMSDRTVFVITVVPVVIACLVMATGLSDWLALLYLVLGFARGWCATTMRTRLTLKAPMAYLTTVESISSTIGRLLYVPLVLVTTYLANTSLSAALITNALMIGLPSLIIVRKLDSSRQV